MQDDIEGHLELSRTVWTQLEQCATRYTSVSESVMWFQLCVCCITVAWCALV